MQRAAAPLLNLTPYSALQIAHFALPSTAKALRPRETIPNTPAQAAPVPLELPLELMIQMTFPMKTEQDERAGCILQSQLRLGSKSSADWVGGRRTDFTAIVCPTSDAEGQIELGSSKYSEARKWSRAGN